MSDITYKAVKMLPVLWQRGVPVRCIQLLPPARRLTVADDSTAQRKAACYPQKQQNDPLKQLQHTHHDGLDFQGCPSQRVHCLKHHVSVMPGKYSGAGVLLQALCQVVMNVRCKTWDAEHATQVNLCIA